MDCKKCTYSTFMGIVGVVYLIFAIICFIYGSIGLTRLNNYDENYGQQAFSVILIFVGLFFIFAGLSGFFNAFKQQNAPCTCLFISLSTLASVLLVSAAISNGAILWELKKTTSPNIQRVFEDKIMSQINTIQENLQCCGLNGPDDWENVFHANIPDSCHKDGVQLQRGCETIVTDALYKLKLAFGTCLTVTVLTTFGFCTLMCLKGKNSKTRNTTSNSTAL